MSNIEDQIAHLEALRSKLGNAAVEAAIAALRDQPQPAVQQNMIAERIENSPQIIVENYHASDEKIDIDLALENARTSVYNGNHTNAKQICGELLRAHPDLAEAHLIWAVAALGGRYADHIGLSVLASIEHSLMAATQEPKSASTAWAILGVIAFDAYHRANRLPKNYSLIRARQAVQTSPIAVDQALFRAVRATPEALQKVFSLS